MKLVNGRNDNYRDGMSGWSGSWKEDTTNTIIPLDVAIENSGPFDVVYITMKDPGWR